MCLKQKLYIDNAIIYQLNTSRLGSFYRKTFIVGMKLFERNLTSYYYRSKFGFTATDFGVELGAPLKEQEVCQILAFRQEGEFKFQVQGWLQVKLGVHAEIFNLRHVHANRFPGSIDSILYTPVIVDVDNILSASNEDIVARRILIPNPGIMEDIYQELLLGKLQDYSQETYEEFYHQVLELMGKEREEKDV